LTRRKIIPTIFGGAALLFSTLLACALWQAYRARANGDEFLSDVRKLRVGQSTYEDVLRIQANYKSRSSVQGNACDRNLCILDFCFENNWLYHFGLVPGSRFIGSLMVRRGILVKVSLSLLSDPRYDAMTEETPADPNVSVYDVGGRKFSTGQAYSYVWAHITSAASEDERQKAYAFNLSCLTKWGGCKDSNELLPIFKSP
jgi:hypothetical protein